jgi:hypothetical protein
MIKKIVQTWIMYRCKIQRIKFVQDHGKKIVCQPRRESFVLIGIFSCKLKGDEKEARSLTWHWHQAGCCNFFMLWPPATQAPETQP